jgi:hypothetical protein
MVTCTSCGSDVSGKKFCQNCGTPVQPPVTSTPNGQTAPPPSFCTNCGKQSVPGERFCSNCGSPLGISAATATAQSSSMQQQQPYASQYGQPPYAQSLPPYAQQPQNPQYPQQYPQQGQAGYSPQPMMGQQPMALHCPVCMAMSPLGTPNCPSCHTSLAGVVPTPANLPQQGQQGGLMGNLGGMMQGNAGKYAMGALGGAAAVVGGEMLLGGIEHRMEGDYGYGEGYHHRHREEGLLGELGELGNDIGLF